MRKLLKRVKPRKRMSLTFLMLRLCNTKSSRPRGLNYGYLFGLVLALLLQNVSHAADVQMTNGKTVQTLSAATPAMGQIVILPKDVVKKALENLKGLPNSKLEKSQSMKKMKNFSGCFLSPDVKQKVMISIILGGMKSYTFISESYLSSGARVEMDIQFERAKTRVIFDLIYRKKQWWIIGMR